MTNKFWIFTNIIWLILAIACKPRSSNLRSDQKQRSQQTESEKILLSEEYVDLPLDLITDDRKWASELISYDFQDVGNENRNAYALNDSYNCCVCAYYAVSGCGAQRTKNSCLSIKDCSWDNDRCFNRFESNCFSWAKEDAQSSWCQRLAFMPMNQFRRPFEKQQCKNMRFAHRGHSDSITGPTNIIITARICLASHPSCSDLDIDFGGCSAFGDLQNAREQMKRIISDLKDREKETTVKVSANQCISYSNEESATRYNFSITKNGVTDERPGACIPGSRCDSSESSKITLCFQDNGIKSQICCKSGSKYEFKLGRSCS